MESWQLTLLGRGRVQRKDIVHLFPCDKNDQKHISQTAGDISDGQTNERLNNVLSIPNLYLYSIYI